RFAHIVLTYGSQELPTQPTRDLADLRCVGFDWLRVAAVQLDRLKRAAIQHHTASGERAFPLSDGMDADERTRDAPSLMGVVHPGQEHHTWHQSLNGSNSLRPAITTRNGRSV